MWTNQNHDDVISNQSNSKVKVKVREKDKYFHLFLDLLCTRRRLMYFIFYKAPPTSTPLFVKFKMKKRNSIFILFFHTPSSTKYKKYLLKKIIPKIGVQRKYAFNSYCSSSSKEIKGDIKKSSLSSSYLYKKMNAFLLLRNWSISFHSFCNVLFDISL